ncbi:MAG: (Fe-S)-binding protein [Planctomycetaceae bacterium]|nr:(Fe-S)-binding protein [Planctomycetaceae bacterium]
MSEFPSTIAEPLPITTPGAAIQYDLFLDCVHCGLCTSSCPTYMETGNENDSPRGRIYLMRAVTDHRLEMTHTIQRHLELCLDCRACETSCPSGVQYGRLIEPFRLAMDAPEKGEPKQFDWFFKYILFGLFPYTQRLHKALVFAKITQRLKLDQLLLLTGLWKLLPARLGRLATLLPQIKTPDAPLEKVMPAIGRRRARVALFTGCVQSEVFQQTNYATVRVLQENGCDVVIPDEQGCCGAIHYHTGQEQGAIEFAADNLKAFDRDDIDAIIVNVAGCGAMLKEYGHLWDDTSDGQTAERKHFSSKVKDVHEFLDELGFIPPKWSIPVKVTYHDACHLVHAQKISDPPRNLISQIPGVELLELPESEVCCGAAGTYNLVEPEMADRLGERKLDCIRKTGASIVLTGNSGCLMQIDRQRRLEQESVIVMHPMDLIYCAYMHKSPYDY